MKLTDRELATVLAALRLAQDAGEGSLQRLFPFYFQNVSRELTATPEPLTVDEIDELCERINTEGENE